MNALPNSTPRSAVQISARLRRLAPQLREYRRLLQDMLVAAGDAKRSEVSEIAQEMLAFDRWHSFELGRRTQGLTGEQQ